MNKFFLTITLLLFAVPTATKILAENITTNPPLDAEIYINNATFETNSEKGFFSSTPTSQMADKLSEKKPCNEEPSIFYKLCAHKAEICHLEVCNLTIDNVDFDKNLVEKIENICENYETTSIYFDNKITQTMNDIWKTITQFENSSSNTQNQINFVQIYNSSAQEIDENNNISFDYNDTTTYGFIHKPNTSEIIFTASGIYSIYFMIAGVQHNQFALFINNILVPGSIFSSAAGNQQNIGQKIVHANAGDILTIRNYLSGLTVHIQT